MPGLGPHLDPNQRPFQRASFAIHLGTIPGVHVRERSAVAPYFRARNPKGWHHDLGFLDVTLDNLGVVAAQQVYGRPWEAQIRRAISFLMRRWELGKRVVPQHAPWWVEYIRSEHRKAATGEPRSLLRLLPEDLSLLSRAELDLLGFEPQRGTRSLRGADGEVGDFNWSLLRNLLPDWNESNWSEEVWSLLFGKLGNEDTLPFDPHPADWEPAFGALLPDALSGPVEGVRLLHPRHSTPDLPPRVGHTEEDLAAYHRVLDGRNQGRLGTCVAHALCFALELALERSRDQLELHRFSPAWLHCFTGPIDTGRKLSAVSNELRKTLPAPEDAVPYRDLEQGRVTPEDIAKGWAAAGMDSARLRLPLVKDLEVADIASLKAHLAGGWVVVVSTRVTKGVMEQLRDPFICSHGVPMAPLPGDPPEGAHAWCLVGYDHVDGATNWKYQGRFLALNSWGPRFAHLSPYGPGTLTLPFSLVAFEGIEAVALRFRP